MSALAEERVSAEAAGPKYDVVVAEGTDAGRCRKATDADAAATEDGHLAARCRELRRGRSRRRARGRGSRCRTQGCAAPRPGDWYVIHSYAGYENKVKSQPRDSRSEPRCRRLHLPGGSSHRRGHRDQERPAQAGQPQGSARIHPRSHGAQRRVVGRRAQHAWCHRFCRCHVASLAADPQRGRQVPAARSRSSQEGSQGCSGRRRSRRGTVRVLRQRPVIEVDFEVGESVTVMDGPFATLPASRSARSTASSRSSRFSCRSSVVKHPVELNFNQVAKI